MSDRPSGDPGHTLPHHLTTLRLAIERLTESLDTRKAAAQRSYAELGERISETIYQANAPAGGTITAEGRTANVLLVESVIITASQAGGVTLAIGDPSRDGLLLQTSGPGTQVFSGLNWPCTHRHRVLTNTGTAQNLQAVICGRQLSPTSDFR